MQHVSKTVNLCEHLGNISKSEPNKISLLTPGGIKLSYADLWSVMGRVSYYLEKIAITPANPILVLLPNGIDQAALFLTASAKGLSYAPLGCTATVSEIESTARVIGAKTILVGNNIPMSKIQEISELGYDLIVLEITTPFEWLTDKSTPVVNSECIPGKLLITTSGSTGLSKVVQIDFDRLWSSARHFSQIHNCDSGLLVFWNYLPMSYLGGLFNLLLIPIAGGNATLIDDAFNGSTLIKFWHIVEQFRINALWLVPTIVRGLNQLCKSESRTVGNQVLQSFIGTAPIRPDELVEFSNKFGIYPLQNYGLTETTFISTQTHEQTIDPNINLQEGNVGKVIDGVKVKLIPFVGEETDLINQFEIWVETPYLMDGYLYEEGVAPNLDLDLEGFFNTGDLGSIQQGQLIITGRQKDIIKRGGHLIVLSEIEKVAISSRFIAACAAIKINHEFYGEAFVLAVEMEESDSEKISELELFLHSKLSKIKWPETIVVVKRLERTDSGKVSKPAVLKQLEAVSPALRMLGNE